MCYILKFIMHAYIFILFHTVLLQDPLPILLMILKILNRPKTCLKPMIHGPICSIRHVGYDKIWGCLIVYHPLKHHATTSDNVVRKIGSVQFSSDSNQLCRMDKPIKWQVFVHVVMFMICVYVPVLI